MWHRYITNSTLAYSIDVKYSFLATKIHAQQNVLEGKVLLNPVLLELLPATILDSGPKSDILNAETVNISPKPPWPVVYIKADSLKGNFTPQICFSLWLCISCDEVTRKHRPIPWPPFTVHTMILCRVNQSMVKPLICDISNECLQLGLELNGTTMQIDAIKGKGISLSPFSIVPDVNLLCALTIIPFHYLMVRRTMMLICIQKSGPLHKYKRYVVFQLLVLHHVAFGKVSWQVLLLCYPFGVQAILPWSYSAYECALICMGVASIIYLLSNARNCVCHHDCLTQIQLSCIGVRSNTNLSAAHISMASFEVIQLDCLPYFAYPSTASLQVQGGTLKLNSPLLIVGVHIRLFSDDEKILHIIVGLYLLFAWCNDSMVQRESERTRLILKWSRPTSGEYSSDDRTDIAQLYRCNGELITDGISGQTKVPQYLQLSAVIWSETITNQQLIWWDLVGIAQWVKCNDLRPICFKAMQQLLGYAFAVELSQELMRMVCALQKIHCWAFPVSLVGQLTVKPEQTDVTMALQQLISWDPGGNQGNLYGNTTADAASENDTTLHSNSLKAMHILW